MNPMTAQQIAEILGTHVASGRSDVIAAGGVSTDTRTLARGAVFFALRGENFDGDTFARTALDSGASVVIVHQWHGGDIVGDAAVIEVSDTLLALQRLALWWRKQLDLPVIGITGSNGKTSTKDFTSAVLSRKYHVSATRGNLNNHIGVPLTILSTTQEHTAAVWEMGMNHSGEIAQLCEITKPKFGIITNIGSAHIEFFGTRDAIAEEKGSLARALPMDGMLFIPATCEYHEYLRKRTKASIISVGNGRGLVRAENLVFGAENTRFTMVIEGAGTADVILSVPGRHMVTNALLAAGVGWKLGVPITEIAAGLTSAKLTGGRLHRYVSHGITVIDDTYNANPESMAAAIETLSDMPTTHGGRKIIVLGRMGELGVHGPAAHLRTGELAAKRNLIVIVVGEGAGEIARGAKDSLYFPCLDDAAAWLAREARTGDVVLFKGSRTATVEKVMNQAFPRN